jgi:hypothetical protein
MQLAEVRQLTFQQALFGCPGTVACHRLAVHACRFGYSPVALTVLDMSQQFSNIHGPFPFAEHLSLLPALGWKKSMPQIEEIDQRFYDPPRASSGAFSR